jgi:hypothetical protein
MRHNDAIIDLYIHEIAMHHSHNVDDFRPPYDVEEENDEQPDYITPAHIDSLTICLDSIHKAFDAFIEMPISLLRALPTLFFVRNSYAAVALIKMYTAVSAKGSKFGSVFKPKDLKVEYYLDAMVNVMKRASEGGKSRIAMKFIFILGMLKSWQAKREAGLLTTKDKGMLSAKAIEIGWKKQEQLGQNQQDAKKACWNRTATTMNSSSNAKPQHSGLQMLSEVAMGNNNNPPSTTNTNTSDPIVSGALAASTNPSTAAAWDAQINSYTANADMQSQHQQQQQQQPPPVDIGGGDTFNQGYMADIDSFAFTAEELGALGNMMDNPGWLSFGMDSGGWAM